MAKVNQASILQAVAPLFAANGEEFSIRKLAKKLNIAPSVIYYHFENEHELLKAMFHSLNHELGVKRAALPPVATASQMLKQRIEFQIEHQEKIVAVLKYYLAFRDTFAQFKNGFVPDKSALHIEEVLHFGVHTGEFYVKNIEDDAKVITHAINGFLLEYYPHTPVGEERDELVQRIHGFLVRALRI